MEMEELKERFKEKVRKHFPDAKIKEKDSELHVKHKESESVYYLEKTLAEINASPVWEWEGIIEKRMIPLDVKEMKKRFVGALIVKAYPKEQLPSIEKLEKGGLIVIGEKGGLVYLLMTELEDQFVALTKKVMTEEFGIPKDLIDFVKKKSKEKLGLL